MVTNSSAFFSRYGFQQEAVTATGIIDLQKISLWPSRKSHTVRVEVTCSSPYLVLETTSSIFEYPENSTESIWASLMAI